MPKFIINKENITDDQIIGVISAISGAKGFLQRIDAQRYMVVYNHEGDNNLDGHIYDSKRSLAGALGLDAIISFDTQKELFKWLSRES